MQNLMIMYNHMHATGLGNDINYYRTQRLSDFPSKEITPVVKKFSSTQI